MKLISDAEQGMLMVSMCSHLMAVISVIFQTKIEGEVGEGEVGGGSLDGDVVVWRRRPPRRNAATPTPDQEVVPWGPSSGKLKRPKSNNHVRSERSWLRLDRLQSL